MNKRCFVVFIFVLFSGVCGAETITGARVIRVLDGDTFDLRAESGTSIRRCRMAGIDAPEKAQPMGMESKRFLAEMIEGMVVNVITSKTDKYGRSICSVFVDEAKDVSILSVQAGMSFFYRQYARELPQPTAMALDVAERKAKQEGLGVWSISDPERPWDFRRRIKSGE